MTFDGTSSPFDCPTAVCWVEGAERLYLVDTHTGTASMESVKLVATDRFGAGRPVVVLNTHSDWDHVWGNGAFPDALVVAHERCYEYMADDGRWHHALEAWGSARHGDVDRRLPTVTFGDRIGFPGDGLVFFHSPGHTADSSSLWDERDGVLFVGDNLERPLPYLQSHDLAAYLATLCAYVDLAPRHIVTSHSGTVDLALLQTTRAYLEGLADGGRFVGDPADDAAAAIHESNLKSRVVSRAEEAARSAWGEAFTPARFIAVVTTVEAAAARGLDAFEQALLEAL